MNKLKIVISGLLFPLTMLHYFWRAFERRGDVELFVTGPFTGSWIPWNGGMFLEEKYVKIPTFPLPRSLIGQSPDPAIIERSLPWQPDLWIQIDAGFHFSRRPKVNQVVGVITDPHAISKEYYNSLRGQCDRSFCMQTPYMEPGDIYLPYAFDPEIHYPEDHIKIYDGCLIGLHYEQRSSLVKYLRLKNYSIYYDLGKVYDEYRTLNNKSKIILSWSSLKDLPTRVFEAMGMKRPLLTNRVPDLANFFVDGDHYVGFDTLPEAIEKFDWMIQNPETVEQMAESAYRKVIQFHTWDFRVKQILEACKLV